MPFGADRYDRGKAAFSDISYAVTKQDQGSMSCRRKRLQDSYVAFRYFNVYGTVRRSLILHRRLCDISSRLMNDQAPMIFEDGLQSRDLCMLQTSFRQLLALETDKGTMRR